MAPDEVPFARSRAEQFDDVVLDAIEALEPRFGDQLERVEFVVDEVPPTPGGWSDEPVPLGRAIQATTSRPATVVVHRRPIEARAVGRSELAALVREVVVEQVADLLGLTPEQVDPED